MEKTKITDTRIMSLVGRSLARVLGNYVVSSRETRVNVSLQQHPRHNFGWFGFQGFSDASLYWAMMFGIVDCLEGYSDTLYNVETFCPAFFS